jgi:hypothetical protein
MSGYLCRQVVVIAAVPVPLTVLMAVTLSGHMPAPGWTILVGAMAAVASLLLALVIRPSPLPRGLSPQASARRSLLRFRQITHLRLALPMAALGIGAGAARAGGGMNPYWAALALAWPQILLAWPSFHTVASARRGMEAWGARAYLWAGLEQPAPGVRPRPRESRAPQPEPGVFADAPDAEESAEPSARPENPAAPGRIGAGVGTLAHRVPAAVRQRRSPRRPPGERPRPARRPSSPRA